MGATVAEVWVRCGAVAAIALLCSATGARARRRCEWPAACQFAKLIKADLSGARSLSSASGLDRARVEVGAAPVTWIILLLLM